MRLPSRVLLATTIFALPAAFAAACTSFPDLVDIGSGDSSLTVTDGPPTITTTEPDGQVVTTLLDGAVVPDGGSTTVTTGGDDGGSMSPTDGDSGDGGDGGGTGDDDSGATTTKDSGIVDAGPVICPGTVDCSDAANANCLGCYQCNTATGCKTCNNTPKLTCTAGFGVTMTIPCCANGGNAECADATVNGFSVTYTCK